MSDFLKFPKSLLQNPLSALELLAMGQAKAALRVASKSKYPSVFKWLNFQGAP
jgi:hypothetical protein